MKRGSLAEYKAKARTRLKMLQRALRHVRSLKASNDKLREQKAALQEQVKELKLQVAIAKPVLRFTRKTVRW